MPAIAARVLRLARDPDADGWRLAALVERDPSLASTVMRAVCTPAWAGTSAVTTLQQAITRVGARALAELVVGPCLRPVPLHPSTAPALIATWRHAVASAAFARRISAVRRRHVEAPFLCGLLHSIGRTLVLRVSAEPLAADVLDGRAREATEAVCRAWELPPAVQASMLHHASWATAPSHRDACATTWLARRLGHDLEPPGQSLEPPLEDDPVLDELALYPDELAALRDAAPDVRAELAVLS